MFRKIHCLSYMSLSFFLVIIGFSAFATAKSNPSVSTSNTKKKESAAQKRARMIKKAKKIMAELAKKRGKAKGLFFSAEKARLQYLKGFTPANFKKLKVTIEVLIKDFNRLNANYDKVAAAGSSHWMMAAMFRKFELYELLAASVHMVSIPSSLPKAGHVEYRKALELMHKKFESVSLSGYRMVVNMARSLKVKNRWTCLAQSKVYRLTHMPKKAAALACNKLPY